MTPRQKRVLYIQYANPAALPPLEHSSKLLLKTGWEVLFLGVRAANTDNIAFQDPQIRVELLRDCAGGWRNRLRYLSFLGWVVVKALSWSPNWIYASDMSVCPVAYLLSFFPSTQMIYHEHDSPAEKATGLFQRFLLFFRRLLARRALCILPNEQRESIFRKETRAASSCVVWNCPTVDEISSQRAAPDHDSVWVMYHGSIVPQRLPLAVAYSFKLLPPEVKLRVAGYETVLNQGYVNRLRAEFRELQIEDRFEFIGSVATRKELLAWCAKSHVGLALMPEQTSDINMLHMTGASNKPFDYLSSGMCLLVSDLPDWKGLFVDSGYGLACSASDPHSIAGALNWFVNHRDEMLRMGEAGRKKIATDWNYEKQFEGVLALMNRDAVSKRGLPRVEHLMSPLTSLEAVRRDGE
jgi:glycosyltransferase involved in cell wall biosynthesis